MYTGCQTNENVYTHTYELQLSYRPKMVQQYCKLLLLLLLLLLLSASKALQLIPLTLEETLFRLPPCSATIPLCNSIVL